MIRLDLTDEEAFLVVKALFDAAGDDVVYFTPAEREAVSVLANRLKDQL